MSRKALVPSGSNRLYSCSHKAIASASSGAEDPAGRLQRARLGLRESEAEPLVKYASRFHARGARRGRLQTSLDRNVIDYRRVFKAMVAGGYRGWIGVE